jgi:hypothetical protein
MVSSITPHNNHKEATIAHKYSQKESFFFLATSEEFGFANYNNVFAHLHRMCGFSKIIIKNDFYFKCIFHDFLQIN